MNMKNWKSFFFFLFSVTSGDLKAVLAVHHAFVDPHAVSSFQMTQGAVTHLTLSHKQNTNQHAHEERDAC